MSAPHRIRLHGPWEVRPHEPGVAVGRMTVPGTLRDGGWPGYRGLVTFYRRFGRPSNLGTSDIVRLAFTGIHGLAEIVLNGKRLGELSGSAQFDVSQRLSERNELVVTVDALDDLCGIVGDVALEITTSEVRFST